MRLSVSNIGWDLSSQSELFDFFVQEGVSGIEIAPTKIWPGWVEASAESAQRYRRYLADYGFEVPALQAILYGRPDLQVFDRDTHAKFYAHMELVVDVAAGLGATVVVFGSPGNRRQQQFKGTESVAIDFFYRLGELCADRGCYLGIEHNPAEYGCDFLVTADEAERFVRKVSHSNVCLHVDAAGLHMYSSNLVTQLAGLRKFCHYHISEPMLEAIVGGIVDHESAFRELIKKGYSNWVSIEMKDPGSADILKRSVRHTNRLLKNLDREKKS